MDKACSTRRGFPGGFRVYLDAKDAVTFHLSIMISRENTSQRTSELLPIGKYFTRTRFSSIAVRAIALPDRRDKRKEHMINGVPSLDQQSIICARCGGLFVPDSTGVPGTSLESR